MRRFTVLDSEEILTHPHHIFEENRHSTDTEQDGYGGVCSWSGLSGCGGLLCPWRTLRRGPAVRPAHTVYIQNRDCYEVQGCGREGGRSEGLWVARVLCGCEAGCGVLSEHGVGSGEEGHNHSRRRRAPILVTAEARLRSRGGVPPRWSA